ncbi:MAG: DUF2868 domain-containing protein, partial [Planctomycetota bacterium]
MPGKTPIATRDARALLLVQAVEETDRQGRLLPAYERGRATDLARAELDRRGEGAAGASAGGTEAARAADAAIVVRRARLLLEVLRGRLAAVERVTAEIPFAPIALGTIAIALLLGLTSSALGPGRRVNILAVPILGMILWNLAVYLLLILGLLFRRRGPRASGKKDGGGSRPDSETAAPAGTPADGRERGLPARLAHWLLALASRPFRPRGAGDVRLTAEALGRFAALWRGYALPLTVARIRVRLHAGAMALIGGAIAGMYARGLIFEYRATWESTFLEAEQLARLLGAVLAPAAALLGESIPPIAGLEAPTSGAAAPWIHLWAATALIFVGAPRALLALTGAWRARRVAARLSIDLDQGIYRRILAAGRGRECRVEVIPYSYHLGPRRADTL